MLKVVIIDSNTVFRTLLMTIFNDGGHEVVGDTNHSPAGIARVIKLRPQIICIDIGSAGDDGMEILDTIRSELPKTMVFMVSGSIDAAVIEQSIQRGVHGFIVKPFNSSTVLTTIRNAVIKFAHRQRQATSQ